MVVRVLKWLCGGNMKVNGLKVSNLEGLYNKQRQAGRQPLIKAVRCSKCNNLSAFENEDVKYDKVRLLIDDVEVDRVRGFVKCPWCGNRMFVNELDERLAQIAKYYTELSDE